MKLSARQPAAPVAISTTQAASEAFATARRRVDRAHHIDYLRTSVGTH